MSKGVKDSDENVYFQTNNENIEQIFVASITIKGEDYYCEVVVKSNKDRQGFYIHEIELKEKLANVFSTSQQGTLTSSKSIIADLVKNIILQILMQDIK